MDSLCRILPREVAIRFVHSRSVPDAELDERGRRILTTDEHRTAANIGEALARRDYVVAHLLVRTMLGERIGVNPRDLRFRASPGGKPEVVAPRGARRWRFSISHSDGIALCAVSAGYPVGVDVASLRGIGPDPSGVAETICSGAEHEELLATPSSLRPLKLLVLWTLKEAIAKATGLGLRLPVREITVRGDPPRLEVLGLDASLWRLASFHLGERHVAAVAVYADGGRPARLEPPLPMNGFSSATPV